jgi:phage-related protein
MAGKTAILAVRILGDATDATAALAEVDKAISVTDGATKSAGRDMAGVWAAVGTAMTACSVAAGQLEQATVAVETIYGDMADEVLVWAEGMAEYGLSTAQAAQAAAVLGAGMSQAGFSMEQTAKISTELIEISVALAQVMGGTATEAVQAMGAAMRGEYDSLERFGIALTADAVASQVLALEQQGVVFASEQQAKAVATLSLIQQQSTAILGEAEAQQVTMATATNQLRAEITNLAAAIGGPLNAVLGPIIGLFADLVGWLNDTIASSELLQQVTYILTAAMDALASIIGPILTPILETITRLMEELGRLIDTYVMPIVDALSAAFDALADAIGTVVGWVQEAIDWFNSLIGTIHEAIDALTFWNDTYQASTPLDAPMPAVAGMGRTGRIGEPIPNTFNITVQSGVGDPHAIAKEIRRVLRTDAQRMGRPVTV